MMAMAKLCMALFTVASVAGPAAAVAAEIEPDLKVAFLGDQGLTPDSKAVLRLIKGENAHMVLHLGDFDYADNPDAFDMQINEILGPDFPYFAVIGNHDRKMWDIYQDLLEARLKRVKGAECEGEFGTRAACTYKGLFFILSAVGITEPGETRPKDGDKSQVHTAYIKDMLARAKSPWKICAWHKNQTAMQLGTKKNETGWGVYEACRKGGAIIATGHEHSYSRTHLIGAFGDPPVVASRDKTLRLEKGRTFAFVSGLGGRSVRGMSEHRESKKIDPWWAAFYTRDQDATAGALFCTFSPGGQKQRANCYFKAINGEVPDRFKVISTLGD